MAHRKGALKLAKQDADDAPQQRGAGNLFETAYLKIEELLVNCTLKPGRFLTVQELQDLTGFGRTPVHSAVNRLATSFSSVSPASWPSVSFTVLKLSRSMNSSAP